MSSDDLRDRLEDIIRGAEGDDVNIAIDAVLAVVDPPKQGWASTLLDDLTTLGVERDGLRAEVERQAAIIRRQERTIEGYERNAAVREAALRACVDALADEMDAGPPGRSARRIERSVLARRLRALLADHG